MIDVNEPLTNPKLAAAISGLQKQPTYESEKVFLDLLRDAYFLVPMEGGFELGEPNLDGKITLIKGTTIGLSMITDGQDNLWQIAFTDWPSLRAWRDVKDEQTLILSFTDITALILSDDSRSTGLLINPGSNNLPVTRKMLAHFNDQPHPYTIKKETKVIIGEPKDYPHELVKALTLLFKEMREVKRAWLLLMFKGVELGFLIVVDFQGNQQEVFGMIEHIAAIHLKPHQFVDVIPYSDEYGTNAVKNYGPFYRRRFRIKRAPM
jgi:hypothetical protein